MNFLKFFKIARRCSCIDKQNWKFRNFKFSNLLIVITCSDTLLPHKTLYKDKLSTHATKPKKYVIKDFLLQIRVSNTYIHMFCVGGFAYIAFNEIIYANWRMWYIECAHLFSLLFFNFSFFFPLDSMHTQLNMLQ